MQHADVICFQKFVFKKGKSILTDYAERFHNIPGEKTARIRGSGRLEDRRGCDYDTRGRGREEGLRGARTKLAGTRGVTSNAARLRVLYYSAPSERVIIDEAVFA